MVPKKGGAKRKKTSPQKASAEVWRDEEWAPSISNDMALNNLVVHEVRSDRATMGWHPTAGENFPTPHSDELVVFKDYFFRGFGIPIHPFLRRLIDYYDVSLCNLSPNSILHVAIFINLCELYL